MRRTAIITLLLAAAAGTLEAQAGTKWIGVQGAFVAQDDSKLKDTAGFGLGLGAWLNDNLGVELSGLSTDLEARRADISGRETHAFLSGLLNLNPGGQKWWPYVRVGAGATQLDTPWSGKADATTRLNVHAGVGVQAALASHMLGTLEARAVKVETRFMEYHILAGLGLRWGGHKPAVAAPAPPPPPPPPPPPVVEEKPVAPPPPPPPPVEAPKPVVAPPPPPPPPAKIMLDEAVLHFANGKSDLSAEGVAAVRKVAESLKAYKGEYSLTVSGHTDSQGRAAFNKALSKRRADAVAKVLTDAGIPASAVQTVGAGPDQPLVDNKTAANRAKNRRVEIDVKVKGATVETRTIATDVQQ